MNRYADIVLRAGVAFAFLYPAVNAVFEPFTWIGYFPPFTRGIVPDVVLLHAFGAFEILIALWILSGWRVFWPSAAAVLLLLSIVVFDFNSFEVLFRDVSIAAAALALALSHYPGRGGQTPPV